MKKRVSLFPYDRIIGFRFVDELVYKNNFERDAVKAVLSQYRSILEEQGQLKNDPYQLIDDWWNSEDNQVGRWLDEIYQHINDGVYSTRIYPEIVKRVTSIKAYGIMKEKCDLIIEAMKRYINENKSEKLHTFEWVHFPPEGERGVLYKKTMHELEVIMDNRLGESEKHRYQESLKLNEWSNRLKASEVVIPGHSFIYWIEPAELVKKIDDSNNSELMGFRDALRSFYNEHVTYRMIGDDLPHLKALKAKMEDMDISKWGEIKKLYRNWIVEDLGRYIDEIENYLNVRK